MPSRLNWAKTGTSKKISLLEQKEAIDPSLLQKISGALKIPIEAFQNFDEEQAVNVIANTFGDHGIGYQKNENCSFNPLDKMVELYERMLQQQKEMIDKLERLIDKT